MSGEHRRSALVAAGLFALAFVLRFAALDREHHPTGDERLHVANAYAFAEHGHLGPDNWYHPPLKHLLTYASLRLVGDDPWGWRIRDVLTGAGTVALTFVLGEALLGSALAAAIAALLLCLDPLHVAFSRSSFEDVPAVFFLLLALVLALRHLRRGGAAALAGAGVSFGIAVALRLYLLVPLAAVGVALVAVELRRGRPARIAGIAAALAVVPFLVYLGVFAPWFRRGYGFGEWLLQERWALVAASTSGAEGFNVILLRLGGPARWFTSQFGVGFHVALADGRSRDLVLMNDAPIWILVLPATVALAALAVRARRWELAAVPVAFTALYVPFLVVPRPIFLYSSVAVLPFGFLAVGAVAERLLRRWARAFLVLATAWGLYLYPLAVGAPIPEEAYEWILGSVDLVETPR